MIARSYIKANLERIERLYNKSSSIQDGLFYSKLAILELCGWIEISMDDIVFRLAKKHLRRSQNINYVEKEVIKRTFGFDYSQHFRKMLINIIGIVGVEKLEKKIDSIKHQLMISSLDSMKLYRNSEAHTYIKGTTRRMDAPSLTKNRLNDIYNGLKNIDDELRRISI
ncbi:MAG: hypothetical protein FP811_13495 [Desulfobacteraceae bacterium]|nr:hypothetical protein [Desulfobacteraceae bacterium]MCG2831263.1 hypothetical protein [Desulfobacteraceae bacterium]